MLGKVRELLQCVANAANELLQCGLQHRTMHRIPAWLGTLARPGGLDNWTSGRLMQLTEAVSWSVHARLLGRLWLEGFFCRWVYWLVRPDQTTFHRLVG